MPSPSSSFGSHEHNRHIDFQSTTSFLRQLLMSDLWSLSFYPMSRTHTSYGHPFRRLVFSRNTAINTCRQTFYDSNRNSNPHLATTCTHFQSVLNRAVIDGERLSQIVPPWTTISKNRSSNKEQHGFCAPTHQPRR